MADPSTPWLDDPIVNANAAPAPTKSPDYTTPSADQPWASDPIASNGQQTAKAPMTQDDINSHLLGMLNDKRVSGQNIRDYYTSLGSQISEPVSKILDDRDTYIKANGDTPTIGIDPDHQAQFLGPNLVDNRPYSFGEGVREGVQHVTANVVGGAGWVANKLGDQNNWAGDLRQHFHDLNAPDQTRGSAGGKIAGELVATAPVALIAPEGEAGLLARSAYMAGDGALQGALTTNATTPGGVVKDATAGAVLGTGLGNAAHALGSLAATPTRAAQQGREVLDAANRLSRDGLTVAPLPGDTGGALARGLSATADAGIVSNVPYRRGVDAYLDATQAVRDRAAQSLNPTGAVRNLDAVAGDVRNGVGGLGDYEQRSSEQIGRMYDNADTLTGDTQIQTPRTLDTLNRMIAEADETPGSVQGVDALRALREDLTPTPDRIIRPSLWDRIVNGARTQTIPGDPAAYAINSLRRLRTSFGDNFDANQRAAREAANQLWGPLSEDIQNGLRSQGLDDAADAYRNADRAWAQRQTNLDEIVHPVLGNRSQEQLADHLEHLSRNDSDKLDQALSLMRPDQAAQVRSALVGNLGRSTSGAQNAAGDAFSINGFLTDWDKLAAGTKASMLNGQAGQDLQDLARMAQAARSTGRYRNTSGTARSADALGLLKSLVSSGAGPGGGFALGGIPGALTGIAGQYGLGAAMASPALARGLVRAGEVRPIARSAQALAKLGRFTGPIVATGVPDDQ